MIRNVVFRIPLLRTFIPRGTRPLLPLTRLTATHDVRISLGGPQRARLFQSSAPRRLSPPPSPSDESHGTHLPPNASLSQKLKHLIKSYGWYALGVYIILSTLDFTVAFAAVNILGAEHVTHATNAVKEMVSGFFPAKPVEPGREEIETSMSKSGGSEGIWAMLVLAYTIHKTLFLPVRVGLTAAVTPRLVHWLRSKGWAGSAGTKRAAQEMREKIRHRRDSRD